MREIRTSGSEGGETELNRSSLPLSFKVNHYRFSASKLPSGSPQNRRNRRVFTKQPRPGNALYASAGSRHNTPRN